MKESVAHLSVSAEALLRKPIKSLSREAVDAIRPALAAPASQTPLSLSQEALSFPKNTVLVEKRPGTGRKAAAATKPSPPFRDRRLDAALEHFEKAFKEARR